MSIGTSLALLCAVLALSAAAIAFVRNQSRLKTRWGIDLAGKACPTCGTPLPQIRKPANLREMLWGGSTCAKCGTALDKYGRSIAG